MARGGLRRTVVAAVVLPLAGKALEKAARDLRVKQPDNRYSRPMEQAARMLRRL